MNDPSPAARRLFGFTLNPGTQREYVALAREAVRRDHPVTVLYHNLHSLYLWYRSPELRSHYAGCTVLVDGMPLIALLRAAGFAAGRAQRVTYVDLIFPLLEAARDEGMKVFHLGQSADVQALALQRIRADQPVAYQMPGIDQVQRQRLDQPAVGARIGQEVGQLAQRRRAGRVTRHMRDGGPDPGGMRIHRLGLERGGIQSLALGHGGLLSVGTRPV